TALACRSFLDRLVGEHAVVYSLAAEHVLPFRDVGPAADHRLDDAEVLDVLGAADHHGADDAVAVQQEFAVDVGGRIVKDDRLEAGRPDGPSGSRNSPTEAEARPNSSVTFQLRLPG